MTADVLESAGKLVPRVRELAPTIESERRLPTELAEAFGGIGLWRACIPLSTGGLELPLATQLAVFEELGRADGSVGCCAMIGATSGLIYAYIAPDVARGLVSADPEACTCGVFAPSGRAVPVEGGYRVGGRWAFGSGVQNAARMGLGVMVMDGDGIRALPSGAPDARGVLVDAGDYEIVDTWTVSGLRGTGSHDVAMDDVFVPHERTYVLIGGRSSHPGPLYAVPIFGVLALGVAAVCLGIARSAVDELTALAGEKTATGARRRLAERGHVQMEVARAEAELQAARAFVSHALNEAWERAESGDEPTLEHRAVLRLAATNAARSAASVVDRMYDAGGGTSIYSTSRLQRDFRDVHTATQHMVVAPPTLELAGRVLLGVETDVSQL